MLQKVVLCMKWGSLYGPGYVNVLYNACKNNISGDFRFVCLTDDSTGLLSDIETYPIPEIGCTPVMWANGAWPKLSVFLERLYGLEGRALFIDMDTVIYNNIDRFFEYKADFAAIDVGANWRPDGIPGGAAAEAGTGVFAFNLGEQSQILSRFSTNPRRAFEACKLEQVWVQRHVSSINYWPAGWVISFKRWLRRPMGLDLLLKPKNPPADASIIAFHGRPRPMSLVDSKKYFWDEFPHLGHGQVEWMRNYWVGNGGEY